MTNVFKMVLACTVFVLVSCGADDKKSKNPEVAPITEAKTVKKAELTKADSELPAQVVTRIPVGKDGKLQYDKAEMVSVEQSVDMDDSKAVHKTFEAALAKNKIELDVHDGLNNDAASSEQCWGCGYGRRWPRSRFYVLPWRGRVASRSYDVYYRRNFYGSHYYRPYRYGRSCYSGYANTRSYYYSSYSSYGAARPWYRGNSWYRSYNYNYYNAYRG